MSKKGGVLAEAVGNFVFVPIATILLIIIFFSFLFLISDDKLEIRSLQTNQNTIRLIGLLRSPIEIGGVPGTYSISELVVYSVKKNNFVQLEEEIKSRFDVIYNKKSCPGSWRFVGYNAADNKELFSFGKLRDDDLGTFDYRTFFLEKGIEIFTGVDVTAPAYGNAVLSVDAQNYVNLTLYVGC